MKNWRSALLPNTASLREAMRAIDQSALRICLVVGAGSDKLLGTVTDGDIRRALLHDANMDDSVSSVMNTQPTAVLVNTSRSERLHLMQKQDLTALPLVDVSGTLVGLETLHQAMQPDQLDNPVFIMAGGFGTRLQPLTDHCPKPMLRVGDKPMLEHLINQFKQQGFSNFYISTHYLPEVIYNHFGDGSSLGVRLNYVYEDTPLGTGGALGLLPCNLPELPLIMVNGDVLTKSNYALLLAHHNKFGFAATVCVREDEYRVPFGVIETENQLIVRMEEKPTYRYKINTGIYVLNPEIIRSVSKEQHIDMPTLLEQHREQGAKIGTFTSYDYWLDIGQMKDYQKAQQDIKTYFSENL